jgi:hypothetical protein
MMVFYASADRKDAAILAEELHQELGKGNLFMHYAKTCSTPNLSDWTFDY